MTPEQVDKLITFGQMATEQGWYDQASEHFEQALALDASNREAIEGLEQVDKALERKAFWLFGISQGNHESQPMTPPHLGVSSIKCPDVAYNKCSPCEILETQRSLSHWKHQRGR